MKTLKTIRYDWKKYGVSNFSIRKGIVKILREDDLKQLAVEWVKKDNKEFGYDTITDRWMKRLDISNEDLE